MLRFAVVVGSGKAQQFCDAFFVRKILAYAFFQDPAKLFPAGCVFFRIVRRHIFQHAQHFFGGAGADAVDIAAVLQNFARHIQRQVIGVDHATHEAQIMRHELVDIFHDEHAPHIQLDAMLLLAIPQIERRMPRHIQQQGIFLLAFDLAMHMCQRRFEIVRHMLVKLRVLLLADVCFGSCP